LSFHRPLHSLSNMSNTLHVLYYTALVVRSVRSYRVINRQSFLWVTMPLWDIERFPFQISGEKALGLWSPQQAVVYEVWSLDLVPLLNIRGHRDSAGSPTVGGVLVLPYLISERHGSCHRSCGSDIPYIVGLRPQTLVQIFLLHWYNAFDLKQIQSTILGQRP
jgi:hypothetical protein